ncbi:MAG: tetratricopeptide repeat protein [Planctomycetota bacterium]|nr:tetratricopeptide repeat protein [Planctomycetota bacterium]
MNHCDSHWLAVAYFSLFWASVAIAEDDQVFLRRGGVVAGTLSTMSPTEVTMQVGEQNKKVSVAEIRLVSFADEPTELREARSRAVAGKYSQAQQDLQRVPEVNEAAKNIRSDLRFYRALVDARMALTSGGDKALASEAMLDFVRSAPTSYHFFEAAEVLGDLAVAQGEYASAVRYYGSIASKAPWPVYKMHASLLEARALIDQGKITEAKAKYQSVVEQPSRAVEAKRLKVFATIGLARCVAEDGDPTQGVQAIQKVIKDHDSSDTELFGRAYNVLGDCYRVAKQPKDALMAYLHVDVLFYAEPEVHAESLHWIAQLWEEAGKSDRATVARNLLANRYGGSRWSEK